MYLCLSILVEGELLVSHLPSRLGELGRFRFVEVQLANLHCLCRRCKPRIMANVVGYAEKATRGAKTQKVCISRTTALRVQHAF